MSIPPPNWAMREPGPGDRDLALAAHRRNALKVGWRNGRAPKAWARQHGWPTPWFGFHDAFVAKMLESDETFAAALASGQVDVEIPKSTYRLPSREIAEMDEAYASRSYRWLVEALREIRRAVEAGVSVQVDDSTVLTTWDGFYTWAHGRYHALEDDVDTGWIGDDG